MCKVLLIDNDRIERHVTREVLNKNFDKIESIYEADNNDEAFRLLNESEIDLIISNMAHSVLHLMKLVNFAKTKNPKAAIILTTAKSEQEVAHAVLKLKADGYLLKPFKPEMLLNLADHYISKEYEADADVKSRKSTEAIKTLKEGVREHLYKKCILSAKRYVDDIYDNSENSGEICDLLVEYTQGIAQIAEEYKLAVSELLASDSRQVKLRFEKYAQRYNAYNLVSDMINQLFDDMDREYLYTDDVTKVLNYIDRNIRKGITLDQASEYVNMSSCYFSKLFKKATNDNFITYVTDGRIELAKEMLRYTNMPVINIAYELSYSETNYFSKAFKKKVGMTPTEYREQFAQKMHR